MDVGFVSLIPIALRHRVVGLIFFILYACSHWAMCLGFSGSRLFKAMEDCEVSESCP